jgi:hypothetical protein
VNESDPVNPALGVYVTVPSALGSANPFAGELTIATVPASIPTSSVSFDITLTVTGAPCIVVAESFRATGGGSRGQIRDVTVAWFDTAPGVTNRGPERVAPVYRNWRVRHRAVPFRAVPFARPATATVEPTPRRRRVVRGPRSR